MLRNLGSTDMIVLVIALISMPVMGILASLRKKTSEDYFLAGRKLRWWTVAGSVFGTNVNASQMIGMLGIGYSIGFAQSHYEILAVAAILLLCYVFLPAYRKLKVFTLSQYLEHRYNEQARLIYSILMLLLILVQLVGAFYIGSRSIGIFFQGGDFEISYATGIVLIGLMTCSYTLYGGMEAVAVTDTLQTVMILIAALIVAVFTFSQAEIGGFTGLLALEAQLPAAEQKMHLYLPTSHPDLPWSGAFTGLVILHLFYWTTNQYLVQRTLAARSDSEARIGAIVAGFLKLGIPFFSIAAGVAAAHLFRSRPETQSVLPDDAFLRLVETVVPIGYGLTGFIMAGLAAATFSSIDSMMNSATTLVTLDIYKKYLRPDATEQQMVRSGRLTIVLLVILSAGLAMLTYDPTSAGNFFLRVSAQGSYLTQGVVVAFFMGIVWRRTNGRAAVITMLAAPLFAIAVEWLYNTHLHSVPALQSILGDRLNFLHRVLLTLVFCTFLLWGLSRWWSKPSVPAASAELQLTSYAGLFRWVAVFALLQVVFLTLIYSGMLGSATLAVPAGLATFTLFLAGMIIHRRTDVPCSGIRRFLTDDRLYAGLLTATAVWMLYAFA